MSSLESICKEACKVVTETGSYIQAEAQHFNRESISVKSRNNLVTHVDRSAEQLLVKGLAPLIPGAGFLTEEDTIEHVAAADQWIIDPLDGTTNFVHSIPSYCISVALTRNNKTVLGIVYELNRQELFYSYTDSPVLLNGERVGVSPTTELADALIATGFPYDYFDKTDQYLDLLKALLHSSRGIRRLGSAAADLAYVACGRFDGFYEYNLQPWDVAAGAFLVQQAGGHVCDFSGAENFLFGKEIIASNAHLNMELKHKVSQHFL